MNKCCFRTGIGPNQLMAQPVVFWISKNATCQGYHMPHPNAHGLEKTKT